MRQQTLAGRPFTRALEEAGIVPGIKVDAGTKPLAGFAGEVVTEGLDGLRERLAEYAGMGARFAKWRAVIRIGQGLPSRACIGANAHALARYAALSQEAGLVPIVEPEVLMEGDHSLARCREVSEATSHAVFEQLIAQGVLLEGMLLKPNMVLPGDRAADQGSVDDVAQATLQCLRRAVPAAVPGIVFLSGGQQSRLASAHLNAMNARSETNMPWALSFSFARAIQQPALELWQGQAGNVAAAQRALFHRADCNRAARRGAYDPATDAPKAA
jgi:fructose-bisphosphate aldolase, class I